MSATSKDEHWLELITQCRSSGLTHRQWCIENGIPVSIFYYHIRALRKKACEVPEAVYADALKQEVVQIPLWEMQQHTSDAVALHMPSICLEMQVVRIEIHGQAGEDVIRNTLLALRQLC
ncbi:MAG: IS66 family insertion sequence element accessory protein TnpB [Clostridium sp.]|nr:IS66 family insertion sequence element accessory protein TnpB [Clostridium sp.]